MAVFALTLAARAQSGTTSALLDAIEHEDISAAKAAIDAGASCTTQDQRGYIPLTDAAQQGNLPLFRVVLEACPDINAQDRLGRTALITAVWLQQIDILRFLLTRHPNLDIQDQRGDSAIFYALRSDNDETLSMLVRAGANVNLSNKAGESALSQAITRSEFSNAKLLRAAGAQFASSNDALVAAASLGDIDLMTHLLDYEHADANFHQRYGQPVLCVAAQKGNTVAVRVLLGHGADPNLRDSNQQPPLYWALTSRHLSTVQALIDAHADLRAETPGHRTLLVTAAYYIEDTTLAQRFLDAGVDVNKPDIGGGTALMGAASAGVNQIVEFLLRAGANPTLRDNHDQTAADYARKRNNDILAKRLAVAEAAWNAHGN